MQLKQTSHTPKTSLNTFITCSNIKQEISASVQFVIIISYNDTKRLKYRNSVSIYYAVDVSARVFMFVLFIFS